jgi:hypothetical protein
MPANCRSIPDWRRGGGFVDFFAGELAAPMRVLSPRR